MIKKFLFSLVFVGSVFVTTDAKAENIFHADDYAWGISPTANYLGQQCTIEHYRGGWGPGIRWYGSFESASWAGRWYAANNVYNNLLGFANKGCGNTRGRTMSRNFDAWRIYGWASNQETHCATNGGNYSFNCVRFPY